MKKSIRKKIPDFADKRCKECFTLNSFKRIKCFECGSSEFQPVFDGFTSIPSNQNFNCPLKDYSKTGLVHKKLGKRKF